MQAEKFLNQAHEINREVESLLAETKLLQRVAEQCAGATAAGAADNLRQRVRALDLKISEYLSTRRKIQIVIDAVSDADCRFLLNKRYMHGERWERIAEEMHFSNAHIYRLRKKALALTESAIRAIG